MSLKRRLNHCYAPGCNTGYARSHDARKLSMFKAPADPERRRLWDQSLHRAGKPLTADCVICELPFQPHFIIRDYVHQINGEEVRIPRGKPTLAPDAVPMDSRSLPPCTSMHAAPKTDQRDVTSDEGVTPAKKSRPSTADGPEFVDHSDGTSRPPVVTPLATLKGIIPPNRHWVLHQLDDTEGVCFTSCSLNSLTGEVKVEKAVFFTADSAGVFYPKAFVLGKLVAGSAMSNMQDAANVLQRVCEMHPCNGAAALNEAFLVSNLTTSLRDQTERKSGTIFSVNCQGRATKKGTPCTACRYLRKALFTRQSRLKGRKTMPRSTRGYAMQKLRACTRKNKRLLLWLDKLAGDVNRMKNECAATPDDVLTEKIKSLPPKQQLAVRQCFEASKRKDTRGMRYDKQWILECVLLKMRSPKLYRYMRRQGILTLPSETTIRKYTAQYKGSYGFNEKMLRVLKQKTAKLDEFHRHGGLIIDEMKLSEHLSVTTGAEIEGFVNLGPYTPDEQKTLPCNHGLVVMFVPLVGAWTQVLGAFGSNENVKGDLLAKIVLEATVLAEKAGLFVDYVTCDAASWNRKMWRMFNVRASLKEVICKIQHPVDSSRFLHFFSDFPHLVKNVRNRLLTTTFKTPEGHVSMQFVREALKLEGSAATLKVMPGITSVHVAPNNFEKMSELRLSAVRTGPFASILLLSHAAAGELR
ncbi:hypothetical protein ISCGN_014283 [Ixodes scapularis]